MDADDDILSSIIYVLVVAVAINLFARLCSRSKLVKISVRYLKDLS